MGAYHDCAYINAYPAVKFVNLACLTDLTRPKPYRKWGWINQEKWKQIAHIAINITIAEQATNIIVDNMMEEQRSDFNNYY